MYSVLLVEDERVELDTLKNYVNWEACGIRQVYAARGGRSALEYINTVEPDILITDIQMPGMSGIDLARVVRDEGHECKIVFLTGFDKFEYAKEAISLHAEEFLLKPFQVDEVEALVTSLVKKIDRERHERRLNKMALERMIGQACRGTLKNPEEVSQMYFGIPASRLAFQLMGISGLDEDQRVQLSELPEILYTVWMDPIDILVLSPQVSMNNLPQRIRSLYPDRHFQMILSRTPMGITRLFEAVQKVYSCKEDLFYSEEDIMFDVKNHRTRLTYTDRVRVMNHKTELVEAIMNGNSKESLRLLEVCILPLTDMEQEGCCQNAFGLFLYIHNSMEQKGDMDDQASVPNVLHAERFDILLENLKAYVVQCCDLCRTLTENRMAYYVRKYVDLHYMDACTVEEMADGLKLSPNYLRKKFKEEAGMTILEYLTDKRMKEACHLLRDPSNKVKDVSIAVGYENISYFTQLFAKKFGVTPNEYRKTHS